MDTTLCRDCLSLFGNRVSHCAQCGSNLLASHDELTSLSIAHLDCDAFYAAVEKRDDPTLLDKPVLIGGGKRGVVSTACYIARRYGPRSAMPMYKALKLCPEAVVLRPNMKKYSKVSREIREVLGTATPLVEPVSVDEAFLDLTGTARLHGRSPAATMAAIARDIESQIGITVSIGLSYNKFLAKMASDLDKPRGVSVIGRGDAVSFLHDQPISAIPGVGPALANRLKVDGLFSIGDLQAREAKDLAGLYGETGQHLARLSRGRDSRAIKIGRPAKSISTEHTFDRDISDLATLSNRLWPMCEGVSARLKANGLSGKTVTLKLKTARFSALTRTTTLRTPTQLAEVLFRVSKPMLEREQKRGPFRLMGIGAGALSDSAIADLPDLLDDGLGKVKDIEHAMDSVRAKFGKAAIRKGRTE
jgi:DNA polymerase-4